MSLAMCAVARRLRCLNITLPVCTRRVRLFHFVLAFTAAVAVACPESLVAQAFNADTRSTENEWCVARGGGGDPPSCLYENLVTCAVAAIKIGGSCVAKSSLAVVVPEEKPVARAVSHPAPARARKDTMSAAQREKLFREFIEWKQQQANQ